MSESQAMSILIGAEPMPDNMTVEAVFLASHFEIHVVTPF